MARRQEESLIVDMPSHLQKQSTQMGAGNKAGGTNILPANLESFPDEDDVGEYEEYNNFTPAQDYDDEFSQGEEQIGPNEACYIGVEPIELQSLIPLDDQAKVKVILEAAAMVSQTSCHTWRAEVHSKMKFYTEQFKESSRQ